MHYTTNSTKPTEFGNTLSNILSSVRAKHRSITLFQIPLLTFSPPSGHETSRDLFSNFVPVKPQPGYYERENCQADGDLEPSLKRKVGERGGVVVVVVRVTNTRRVITTNGAILVFYHVGAEECLGGKSENWIST
jgi:hypothetical protein